MCELLRHLQTHNKDLEVDKIPISCHYHNKSKERFSHDNFLKGFKCLELFHALYPKILALMYGASFKEDELIVSCPSCKNTVTACLYVRDIESRFARIINKIKEMLHFLWPMDRMEKEVFVKVLSVEGDCPAKNNVGDIFQIYHKDIVCPQALYTACSGILVSDESDTCQCPSHKSRIVFKAKK